MSIVPLLAIQTYRFVSSAKNLESYYEESYSNDSSCGNLIKLSLHHFFISQNYDRAMQTGSDTLKKGCIEKDSNGNYTTNSILARYVALYPKDKNDPKDFEKRLNYLNKMAERSFDFKLARAYILLKTGNKLEAQETIDKSISEPEVQLLSSDLLIIKYLEICKKEKFNWCDEFAKKANSSR